MSGLSVRGARQEVTLFASVPLTDERWTPLVEGELVAAVRGEVVRRRLAIEPSVLETSTRPSRRIGRHRIIAN